MDNTVITGMTAEQAQEIGSGLVSFGSTLLDNLIDLLPALAGIAAIGFVIHIVKKKVRA